MLENLSRSLSSIINKISTSFSLDKKIVEESVEKIKKSLISNDVDINLSYKICERIKKRALEEKIEPGITRREHFIKVVYEELASLLGKDFEDIKLNKRPTKILMIGLLGSGKTTTCAKLANYLKKKGYRVGMICLDVYREAALEQLETLGSYIGIKVYGEKNEKNWEKILKNGLEKFKDFDFIIIDTAGRHKKEDKLMEEMKSIYKKLLPEYTFLVIDASTGKEAKRQAEAFKSYVNFGNIIISKMDGSAKGGGCLSACAAVNAKVSFIGNGEKIEDFEIFDSKRFVSRLLGLGDLQTLLEKIEEKGFKEEDAEKIIEGRFNLVDFVQEMEKIQSLGPLKSILKLIPGFGFLKIPEDFLEKQQEKIKIYKYIVQSMTPLERKNPEIIDKSRIERIARGSGRKEEEVREFLNQYFKTKKLIKNFGLSSLKRGEIKEIMKYFKI